jgi:hypothetical protein
MVRLKPNALNGGGSASGSSSPDSEGSGGSGGNNGKLATKSPRRSPIMLRKRGVSPAKE